MLPPQSGRTRLMLFILGLTFCLQISAQSIVRMGSETATVGARLGEQVWPSVSVNTDGGYLVWEDNTIETGSGRGIAAVQLGSDLAATGNPFQVNLKTAGNQEKPQVALLSGGNALVTWESREGGRSGLFGRIVSGTGTFASGDISISPSSTVTNIKQTVRWSGIFRNKAKTRTFKFKETLATVREHAGGASLVPLPDGGAVVVYHGVRRTYTNTWTLVRQTKWNGVRTTTNDYLRPLRLVGDWMQDVYFQRFNASGQKVGSEIQINQYDAFNQRTPSATLLANGNLLVAWVSEQPLTGRLTDNFAVRLYARELTQAGAPVGDEFLVGEDSRRASANPVAIAVGSGFAIYWSQHQQVLTASWDVYGRVFTAANQPAGDPFPVNLHTERDQYAPRVATSGGSQFVIWTSLGQDGSREGVYGRELVGGVPVGLEIPVNTTIASRQHHPVVTGVGQSGHFIGIWSGYSAESGFNLYSQEFQANPAVQ